MIFRLQDRQKDTWLPFNPVTFKIGGDAYKLPDLNHNRELHSRVPCSTQPEILKIKLGTACNYRCKYCRQRSWSSAEIDDGQIDAFLEQIKKFDLSRLIRIEYWGGEPLLYWKHIRKIHDALQYRARRPVAIHLTTNGSLLTKEIVDTLKSFGKYIYKLSHDGPGQYLRSGNALAYPNLLDLHLRLYEGTNEHQHYDAIQLGSEFLINTVLTKNNYHPTTVVEYFKKIFGEDVIIRKMEPAIPYNDRAESWAITPEDYGDFEETVYYSVAYDNIVKNVREYQDQWTLFQGRLDDRGYLYNSHENKCHCAAGRSLCVDLYGHIVPCQVFEPQDVLLGQIVPTKEKYTHVEWFPRKDKDMFYPVTRTEPGFDCMKCPVISLCRGVCSFLPTNEFTRRNCQIRFHTYRALLRAFLKHKFNLDIVDIRPTTNEEDVIWTKMSIYQ